MQKRNGAFLGGVLTAVLILAACSSGLETGASPPGDLPDLAAQATTVTKLIPTAPSDAEEHGASYYNDSTVLELGEKSAGVSQLTGLRFDTVGVPRGATITSAKITFLAVTDQATATSLAVRGEETVNAPEYTAANPKISARPKTSAVVNWSPGAWTNGASYSTVELKAVMQELVNQSGWTTSSAAAFTLTGTGLRKAAAYDGGSANPATLSVTYDLPPAGVAKVYVLWGQSNAQGVLYYKDQPPAWQGKSVPQASIWFHKASSFQPLRVDNPGTSVDEGVPVWGSEMQLAYDAHAKNPFDKIYIIKFAEGGTPLVKGKDGTGATWNPKPFSGTTSIYPAARTELQEALGYIRSRETKPVRLEGFIWIQGGQDAKDTQDATNPVTSSQYAAAEKALFDGLRAAAGMSTLPVFNTLLPPRTGAPIINAAKRDVAGDLTGIRLLSGDNFNIQADGSHYTACTQRYIGSEAFKYFELFPPSPHPRC